MKKSSQVNILLFAMLFLFSAYLGIIGTMGIEEHRQTALRVLLFGTPIGILLAVFPSLDQKLSFFAKRTQGIILLLGFITLVDLLYISTFKNLLYDEASLLDAVQLFLEQGKDYFFNHYAEIPWLGRQHPPLPVLTAGYIANFFGGNVFFPARIIALLLGLGTAFCTYLITRQLYDRSTAWFAVILLFALRQLNFAQLTFNNDIFVTFFFTLTVLLVLKLKATESKPFFQRFGWAITAGIVIGLGLLSKYTMVFGYLMLFPLIHWPFSSRETPNFLAHLWSGQRSNLGLLLLSVLCSFLLFSVWIDYLFRSGVIHDQASTLLYYLGADTGHNAKGINVITNGYFSAWRLQYTLEALAYRIPSGIGFYNLPLLGLGIRTLIRQHKSGENVAPNGFIRYWVAIIFIPVLIALPESRYFMPAFPALAILMAIGLKDFYEKPVRILLLALTLSYAMVIVYFS